MQDSAWQQVAGKQSESVTHFKPSGICPLEEPELPHTKNPIAKMITIAAKATINNMFERFMFEYWIFPSYISIFRRKFTSMITTKK